MNQPAISIDAISKSFELGARRSHHAPLVEVITEAVRQPFLRALGRGRPRQDATETLWALRDVSFAVQPTEVVGIVGRNGAGKSTLLKIISRITAPTSGRITIRGRVSSLLEVGTGFHQELTGRENIYMNGSILGMRKAEIDRRFDEIVDFAGVERFLDTPLKRYSSGMQVRLAFAVAAHLEPEILIVDEVLAVGDAEFQRKCLKRMGDVASAGRTILFVSHNLDAVRTLCTRAVWLQDGTLVGDGDAAEITRAYLDRVSNSAVVSTSLHSASGDFEVTRVTVTDVHGSPRTEFHAGETVRVVLDYRAKQRIERPHFWVGLGCGGTADMAASMLLDGHSPEAVEGEGQLAVVFDALPLVPNHTFLIRVGARRAEIGTFLFPSSEVAAFRVIGKAEDVGLHSPQADNLLRESVAYMTSYTWELPDGSRRRVDPGAAIAEKARAPRP